ncbi:hypothetical protein [Citricoccus sp. NR2]|uniref:hypothetical protein n=1 Tax=Citricoccus sp. NR2 TaxID=3004095 RepID=UPI0022DDB87F|nr:hypothetical protein [Citricoccus sp. NR2]WBL18475.1 hypothetical protein O1A05_12005 [Citricoccus sp. NR2]
MSTCSFIIHEGARWEPDEVCDWPAVEDSGLCERHHHDAYMADLLADVSAGR